jgi:two-component system, sensor histidine kinase
VAPELPAALKGDPTRLRQVLINLVSNGLKFTPSGGVSVRASPAPRDGAQAWVRFEVTDTGIGIAEPERAQIFKAFVQADSSTTRRYGGSGLGLAIVKQLVEALGGGVGVDSVPGRGSTFWFDLPFGIGDPGQVVVPVEHIRNQKRSPLRILVVEDVKLNRDLIGHMLEREGHEVEFAVNGAEAVELAKRNQLDAILMDVQMPVMDGIEATRRIRALPVAARCVPIIGLTANVLASERERYLSAGMNVCLTKPVDWAELFAALDRNVGNQPRREQSIEDEGRAGGIEPPTSSMPYKRSF